MTTIPIPLRMKYENKNPNLLPDEPWFLIRARDILSIKAIEAYQKLCDENGLLENGMEIAAIVARFKRWQRDNKDKIRMPRTANKWEKPRK